MCPAWFTVPIIRTMNTEEGIIITGKPIFGLLYPFFITGNPVILIIITVHPHGMKGPHLTAAVQGTIILQIAARDPGLCADLLFKIIRYYWRPVMEVKHFDPMPGGKR
ncbi:MAG: hypothetical protein AB1585_14400 [Thermodesulfobacteriota bacterium]